MKNIVGKRVRIVTLTDPEGVSGNIESAIRDGSVFTITDVRPGLPFPVVTSGQGISVFAAAPEELRYLNNRRVVL